MALESFEGSLHGVHGTFNYFHLADTKDGSREKELVRIVPNSGTGELAGIRGTGCMSVEEDGTHRIAFDYELG